MHSNHALSRITANRRYIVRWAKKFPRLTVIRSATLSLAVFIACLGCTRTTPERSQVLGQPSNKVRALLSRYGEVRVRSCTERLTEIMSRVALSTDPLVQVAVLDTGEPLALSPGGGTILVSRGLLQLLPTEGQAAFMLAHEVSHYALGHVGSLVEQEDERNSNERRELELAADAWGLTRVVEGGYAADEAVTALKTVYQAIQRNAGSGVSYDEYPTLPARISSLAKAVLAAQLRGPGTIDRREWQRCRMELGGAYRLRGP
jgi:predicted Zn-dependent protease